MKSNPYLVLVACLVLHSSCAIGTFINTAHTVVKSQRPTNLSGRDKPDTVAFKINSRNWIALSVSMLYLENSKTKQSKKEFIFDTGASTVILDSTLGAKLGAKKVKNTFTTKTHLAKGHIEDSLKTIRNIILQVEDSKWEFKHLLYKNINMRHLDDTVYGLLGSAIICKSITNINFENNEIVFNAERPSSGWYQYDMYTVGVSKSPIIKNIKIGNLPQLDWFVDTGNPSELLISSTDPRALIASLGSFEAYEMARRYRGSGASGAAFDSLQYFSVSSGIKGIQTNRYGIKLVHNTTKVEETRNNMGLAFMRKVFSEVVFDYPGKKFYFKLAPITDSSSGKKALSEIALINTIDSVFVRAIAINSTWFKQGLRADDFITAVNGKPVSYWLKNLEEFRKTDYESFEFVDKGVRRTIYK